MSPLLKVPPSQLTFMHKQGQRQEFPNGEAESPNQGAIIRLSGYYECQKSPKNRFSLSDRELACSNGRAIAPSPALAPPPVHKKIKRRSSMPFD